MRRPRLADHPVAEIASFTRVLAAILALVAAVGLWRHGVTPRAELAAAGAALVLAWGLVAPSTLRRPFHAWMTLAWGMNFVATRVLLTVLFVVVMLPTSVAMRLARRDPLQLRTARGSYWTRRPTAPRAHFERQYVHPEDA